MDPADVASPAPGLRRLAGEKSRRAGSGAPDEKTVALIREIKQASRNGPPLLLLARVKSLGQACTLFQHLRVSNFIVMSDEDALDAGTLAESVARCERRTSSGVRFCLPASADQGP